MVWLGAFNWFTAGVWFILTLGTFLASSTSQAVFYGLMVLANLLVGFFLLRKAIRNGHADNV